MGTLTSGKFASIACISSKLSRTACIATRSWVRFTVVSSATISNSWLSRTAWRAQALSLPLLQASHAFGRACAGLESICIARGSMIQEIFVAHRAESRKTTRPARYDFGRSVTSFQALDRRLRPEKLNRFLELEFLRVHAMQGICNLKPGAHGLKPTAIGDRQGHALAGLTAIRALARRELRRGNADSGNLPTAELLSEVVRANPGRANNFKGLIGAAPNRNTASLQYLDAGIQEFGVERAQIRRRGNPFKPCLVVGLVAPPIPHGKDP